MKTLICLLCFALLALPAAAQQVVSVKAGTIQYTEGAVLMNGKAVEPRFAEFPRIAEQSTLTSNEGRAEVLLLPGATLWMGEDSSLTMLSNSLTNTRLRLDRGSAVLEILELLPDNEITLLTDKAVIGFQKGLYRLNASPARLLVYDGEAAVTQGDEVQRVKKSQALALNGVSAPEKFDNKAGDPLFRWARRRSEYMAMANVSAAKYVRDNRNLYSSSLLNTGWIWNPWFGMMTYVPYRGVCHSFWGYSYWSPSQVYVVYTPRPVYHGGGGTSSSPTWNAAGGYHSVPQTSSGSSGVVAATSSAPAASSAPSVPHGGGASGGGRSR